MSAGCEKTLGQRHIYPDELRALKEIPAVAYGELLV